jgi:hypothetical protein
MASLTPHPFADTLARMRREGGGFASLTEHQKWEWHADVYAFRRVMLGISPEERRSPPDSEGRWFNETLIGIAERFYRHKHAGRRPPEVDAGPPPSYGYKD